jgi:GNAT superfamily N-acetyltransferase
MGMQAMPASAASGGSCISGEGYGQDVPVSDLVELRDGACVLIRPVTGEDRRLLLAGFARFGERSRMQRFMGIKVRLTEAELAFFTEVDQHDHVALGALDAETGEGVGIGRFVRLEPGGNVAEAAIAVVDAWQGRGVAKALLQALSCRAEEEGVEHFQATVRADNRAMLRGFARIGDVEVVDRDLDTMEICVRLPVYRCAMSL